MNLLIDIGNSRIKWIMDTGKFSGSGGSFAYTVNTLAASLDHNFTLLESQPVNVYVSNVAGDEVKSKARQWVADRFGVAPEFAVSQREKCGLINAYIHADQLGVDRFLAMIGAQSLTAQPIVVADFGTATTVDCINSNNEFIGGVILPGLALMRESLAAEASALSAAYANEKINFFAIDTVAAISSGTMLATTGVVEGAVKKLSEITGEGAKCFTTGGDGNIVRPHLGIDAEYQPDLVLKGLSEYFRAE